MEAITWCPETLVEKSIGTIPLRDLCYVVCTVTVNGAEGK